MTALKSIFLLCTASGLDGSHSYIGPIDLTEAVEKKFNKTSEKVGLETRLVFARE